VWPDGEAEARRVVAPLDPIGAGIVNLGPPGRQLVGRLELVVDDRTVPEPRPDDLVTPVPESVDELVQAIESDHEIVCLPHVHSATIVRRAAARDFGADAHC
jgi:hypothetical protein